MGGSGSPQPNLTCKCTDFILLCTFRIPRITKSSTSNKNKGRRYGGKLGSQAGTNLTQLGETLSNLQERFGAMDIVPAGRCQPQSRNYSIGIRKHCQSVPGYFQVLIELLSAEPGVKHFLVLLGTGELEELGTPSFLKSFSVYIYQMSLKNLVIFKLLKTLLQEDTVPSTPFRILPLALNTRIQTLLPLSAAALEPSVSSAALSWLLGGPELIQDSSPDWSF